MTPGRTSGWHRSLGGFAGRTLQAADENRIPFLASALTFDALLAAVPLFLLILAGISWLIGKTGGDPVRVTDFIERFFPPHQQLPGRDPFGAVEVFLGELVVAARGLSWVTVPAFLWFSTRLFASARTSLNEIYDVHVRPVRRHFVVAYLAGKARDLAMVVLVLVLFLVNTALTTGLALIQARGGSLSPGFAFLFTTAGRIAGELLALVFLVSLFFTVYHFASMRRPPWRATVVASIFSAVMFEAAKRLFGLYIRNQMAQRYAVDVNVGAAVLFILWMYYSSLVFLLGGVVAETWELRELQQKQRGR
ncbi:MAG: YihY/virulence factor BrkB family protein [Gemmatimonadales bacterium]